MMDNTSENKRRKSPKNRHIRPPFSPIYLRKCLTNSGLYILSQGTEENSNAICSLYLQNTNCINFQATHNMYLMHILT